jgi:hypothetical protein
MDNYVAEVKALDRNWEPSTASPTAAGIPRSERKHGVLYKQRDVFKGMCTRSGALCVDEWILYLL